MKNNLFLLSAVLIIITSTVSAQVPKKSFLVCGDSKILLVDYNRSRDTIPNLIWSWNAHEAMDLPDEYRTRKFNSMDDCKAISNGKEILVSSSSGAIGIINRKSRKMTFYASVPNAHSIELLPGKFIAAAASTSKEGNKVMLFHIDRPNEVLYTDSLYSAHGTVWDRKRKRLYALGYDVLREYALVTKGKTALELKNEWKLPHNGGHDLIMSPDGNNLYLTIEHAGAWAFSLPRSTFSKTNDFTDAVTLKSVGKDKSGQNIFTIPEQSWWTYHVKFSNPGRVFAFPGLRVYKARWFFP
jgi:hypothetical protein